MYFSPLQVKNTSQERITNMYLFLGLLAWLQTIIILNIYFKKSRYKCLFTVAMSNFRHMYSSIQVRLICERKKHLRSISRPVSLKGE